MGFASTLLDMDSAKWDSYIRSELYDSSAFGESESVIKADLDYVCGWVRVAAILPERRL